MMISIPTLFVLLALYICSYTESTSVDQWNDKILLQQQQQQQQHYLQSSTRIRPQEDDDSKTNFNLYNSNTTILQEVSSSSLSSSHAYYPRQLQSTTLTPITIPFRMNCGNTTKNHIDQTTSNSWLLDRYFSNNSTSFNGCHEATRRSLPISNHLCQTRNHVNFTYNIPVSTTIPGRYNITLYFIEPYFTTSNKRIFSVSIENTIVISNMDTFVTAGGILKPIQRSFLVDVRDGFITINAYASINRASLSAIEIVQQPIPLLLPTTTLSTVRINSGAFINYTDPITNTVWMGDTYFQGGFRYLSCPVNAPINILCSERNWFGAAGTNGTYTIPVIPGRYIIKLLFNELYFDFPNQRLFNIIVQNQIIRSNFDILLAAGGKNITHTITSIADATVVDPTIRLTFTNVIQQSKISGIEVVPYTAGIPIVPTRSPTRRPTSTPTISSFQDIRINCGNDELYTDSLGEVWKPDQYFTGGMAGSYIGTTGNTLDFDLYKYDRAGETFTYTIPIPIGSYEIALYFSETEYTLPGQRVFDVIVEDQEQTNLDIIQLAGGTWMATRLVFFQIIEDGALTIQFRKSSLYMNGGVPKVSAIKISLEKSHIAHAVATGGPYVGTVTNPITNTATVQLVGQTSHTHGDGLVLNNYLWKLGATVIGTSANVNYTFPVGTHTISLRIQDDAGNVDTEVTTVTIRPFGFPAITTLQPNFGGLGGMYNITIAGSGFTYSSSMTTVRFGTVTLPSTSIHIINSTTMRILVPASATTQAVGVTVQTPLGISSSTDFNYIGSVPIQWTTGMILEYQKPTVARFGSDSKLYIGTRRGRILKITMNSDFTSAVNTVVCFVNSPNQEAILGLAMDPMDLKSDPDVYFTANRFFHGGENSTSGLAVSGKIRRASGPNLETIVDIITGLPTSDLDHGLNALEFGNNGQLFFTSGSHTNGGLPGQLSSTRKLKENFLSASVNVAYLFHPNFDGTIEWSALDDGNMIASGIDVYAPGLRNPFGLVLHTNGKMYATDNGPNRNYGRMMTDCVGNSIDDAYKGDEINLVEQGKYYGHPNPKRASYFNDPRQCVYRPPEELSNSNYTSPLLNHPSSIDGIIEYHSNHFNGQLRSNLLYIHYGASNNIYRAILTEDGTSFLPSLDKKGLAMNIGDLGLDITQAPNGNLIDVRFGSASIYYYKPVEAATLSLVVKTCFPRRGRSSGNNILSIYGVNMNTRHPTIVTVTVGNVNCPTTFVSSTRVDCRLPGGIGTVDIVVRNGDATSTFQKGYQYISGLPSVGFVLPVYTG